MKLLLDTHIWLWYLLGNPQLSTTLQTTIPSPDTALWLSPISIWETLVLAEKGRIVLQPDPAAWLEQALLLLPAQEAPLNHAIARLSRQIPLPHQDPADRFLVATAIHYGLILATVDSNLVNTPGVQTLS
ncbi:MAG: type II toxin-antitoxin system VapC family toxin [Synechococcales cyanobacterium RU_4_20]|nr:type II toxin-antitoxin system VapC family toxin [Synechococcales cyanobacterium RU_4_20]NJR71605.1 type II toxin-antitoxin system VapC family toxin [Synechococcales cyanobacterium CRU_2_2]